MLDLIYVADVFDDVDNTFDSVFAIEVSTTDHPDDGNLHLIVCAEQTPEGYRLKQLIELKPSDSKFKELSSSYHPFTRHGTIADHHADYAKAFQDIQDKLNSWATASV